jgi:hypothetical protein
VREGAHSIATGTDATNTPMANAFACVSYLISGERIFLA